MNIFLTKAPNILTNNWGFFSISRFLKYNAIISHNFLYNSFGNRFPPCFIILLLSIKNINFMSQTFKYRLQCIRLKYSSIISMEN